MNQYLRACGACPGTAAANSVASRPPQGRSARRRSSRNLILTAALLCGLASADGAHAQQNAMPDFHPLVPIQHEDYARARSHFHTKLLRLEPAPQSFEPMSPPAGVSEVTYSSSLGLRAWLSRPA